MADINRDGLDDLIVCNKGAKSRIYVQRNGGSFKQMALPLAGVKWRNVRVGYVTRNQLPDLVVVEEHFLRIYRGIPIEPYFNFRKPYYSRQLPYAAYDVEILDVNKDSVKDIFVSMADETQGYCEKQGPRG